VDNREGGHKGEKRGGKQIDTRKKPEKGYKSKKGGKHRPRNNGPNTENSRSELGK